MDLNKLYDKQAELDKHILEKQNIKMSKEELLNNTILALLVEVGELANTTRCFKHWSKKGMMDKEVVLDELADVWHFYLSIGNQIKEKYMSIDESLAWIYRKGNLTFHLLVLYFYCGEFGNTCHEVSEDLTETYHRIGYEIIKITNLLDFTDKEVEQAYLKKHEENYKRQREGY